MPTIRRPSWRPRLFYGHKVQALMTTSNLALECDPQWQAAPLDETTRALLIQRDLTAWFLRLPGETETFATLVEFAGYHGGGNRPFRQATFDGPIPLTTGPDPIMINEYRRHMSVVDGRVTLYGNGTHDIWRDVERHLNWMQIPPEDRAALEAL